MNRDPAEGSLPFVSRLLLHVEERWPAEDRATISEVIAQLGRACGCDVAVEVADSSPQLAVIRLEEWGSADLDLFAWDEQVRPLEELGASTIEVHVGLGSYGLDGLTHFLNRYQRLLAFPRSIEPTPGLRSMLDLHRELHDLTKPLVKADYDHGLDTWRWLLRLAPEADVALQCAALFHDMERLESESDARREQFADDYLAFKLRHARRGAELLRHRLTRCGLVEETVEEVCRLVEGHEQPGGDSRCELLNDADGLSFFALNSFGYVRYFGMEQAKRKVKYTLSRLSPRAREIVMSLPHHPLVQGLLDVPSDEGTLRAHEVGHSAGYLQRAKSS